MKTKNTKNKDIEKETIEKETIEKETIEKETIGTKKKKREIDDVQTVSIINKVGDEPEYVDDEEMKYRISELAKCRKDPVYFAKYFTILNLDSGISKIKLYPKQEEFLRFLRDNNRVVAMSARQSGKCVPWFTYVLIRLKILKTKEVCIKIRVGLLYIIEKFLFTLSSIHTYIKNLYNKHRQQ